MKNLKWILIGLVVLLLAGYVSVSVPGVQCSGSMIYCPGVGCVSGPDKCNAGSSGGPAAMFSTTWESFTDGKDLYPSVPKFREVEGPHMSDCSNGTRARNGRCPKFLTA